MQFKRFIRTLLPAPVLSLYHWTVAWLVALFYGLPARYLKIIGITGTKGKTTTANMLWYLLQGSGHKTALVSTALMAIGEKNWLNNLKMTMPGRVHMQKFLRRAVKEGCSHVVIETSSEGLAQWRHVSLPYQVAVFTNLSPEHLEAHGSYEKYRAAKIRLFKVVAKKNGLSIINLDDDSSQYFINQSGSNIWGYTFQNSENNKTKKIIKGSIKEISPYQAIFEVNGFEVNLSLGGEFNAYNALAAMTTALALGIGLKKSVQVLESYKGTPGRLEFIQQNPFSIVVDYAHTPESLEAVYKTFKREGRLIAVLGSCGGGRDKAKRPILGKLAGEYADYVIVTDEDPYDEPPRSIMEAVAEGVKETEKKEGEDYWIIENRREAIHKALTLAREGDVVVITGKGAEQWMCVANNKKIPWDDRQVVREQLADLENN